MYKATRINGGVRLTRTGHTPTGIRVEQWSLIGWRLEAIRPELERLGLTWVD